MSIFDDLSWIAAMVVMAVWLTSIDVASHALRWAVRSRRRTRRPACGEPPVTPILGADALVIAGTGEQRDDHRAHEYVRPACQEPPVAWPDRRPFSAGFDRSARPVHADLRPDRQVCEPLVGSRLLHGQADADLSRRVERRAPRRAEVIAPCPTPYWKGDDCGGARVLELAAHRPDTSRRRKVLPDAPEAAHRGRRAARFTSSTRR